MDVKRVTIIAAACLFTFASACAETTRQPPGRPPSGYPLPEVKKECDTCHLPAGTRKVGELKKNLSGLCLDCHRNREAPAEHKVDIVPKMEVKDLPLFNGKITCVTCHDPHRNTHGTLLRMNPRDLCLVCHPL